MTINERLLRGYFKARGKMNEDQQMSRTTTRVYDNRTYSVWVQVRRKSMEDEGGEGK